MACTSGPPGEIANHFFAFMTKILPETTFLLRCFKPGILEPNLCVCIKWKLLGDALLMFLVTGHFDIYVKRNQCNKQKNATNRKNATNKQNKNHKSELLGDALTRFWAASTPICHNRHCANNVQACRCQWHNGCTVWCNAIVMQCNGWSNGCSHNGL